MSNCILDCRFLKLDDLESFLQDSEKAAARDDEDEDDAEDRLGEGNCLCCQSLHLLFATSATGNFATPIKIQCDGDAESL